MSTEVAPEPNPALGFKANHPDLSRGERARLKVVIGHPMLGLGGSESVVMWLIEALKRDCSVTVATTRGWERSTLNEFYGTKVEEDEVEVRLAPFPWPLRNRSMAALRGAAYQRFARRISGEYDVRISAYNLTDWGLPAFHFLADFSWNKMIRDRVDPQSPGFVYRDSLLRKGYLALASAIAAPSGRDLLADDRLVANSHWAAQTILQACNVQCATTIYPPVWGEFPDVPWDQKKDSFVMIGRIAPEKQIEKAVSILSAVRDRGHSINLHLCGQIEEDLYGRRIIELCRLHSGWIIPEGRVSGERKTSLLASCRYGIQARSSEPFGISVAEMVKAGGIVFVPNEGGQAEIVRNPDLLYSSESDAVEKILSVLEDPSRQSKIRLELRGRAQEFSTARFISSVRSFLSPILRQRDRLVEGSETSQA